MLNRHGLLNPRGLLKVVVDFIIHEQKNSTKPPFMKTSLLLSPRCLLTPRGLWSLLLKPRGLLRAVVDFIIHEPKKFYQATFYEV